MVLKITILGDNKLDLLGQIKDYINKNTDLKDENIEIGRDELKKNEMGIGKILPYVKIKLDSKISITDDFLTKLVEIFHKIIDIFRTELQLYINENGKEKTIDLKTSRLSKKQIIEFIKKFLEDE